MAKKVLFNDMKCRRNILLVDGIAASCAGISVILLLTWLQDLYQLPKELLMSIAFTNLLYAAYSLSLSQLKNISVFLIIALVTANSIWVINCLRLAVNYYDIASIFGLLHLLGEALFVAALAYFEWKWRGTLVTHRQTK